MKIIIPEQYREHFAGGVIYATPWKKPSLLLMNQKESIEFQEILRASRVCVGDGSVENLTADIVELPFDGIAINVPSYAERLLVGEIREFAQGKAGLLVK